MLTFVHLYEPYPSVCLPIYYWYGDSVEHEGMPRYVFELLYIVPDKVIAKHFLPHKPANMKFYKSISRIRIT